jgi:hypothetical protein
MLTTILNHFKSPINIIYLSFIALLIAYGGVKNIQVKLKDADLVKCQANTAIQNAAILQYSQQRNEYLAKLDAANKAAQAEIDKSKKQAAYYAGLKLQGTCEQVVSEGVKEAINL